jgi:methionine biosynthesis protein MetW
MDDGTGTSVKAALLTDDRARGFVPSVDPLRYHTVQVDEQEAYAFALSWTDPGSRVLDVGCATGEFAMILRNRLGCDVVGIEANAQRAQRAAERIDVHIGYLDRDFSQRYGLFDTVLFLDVLEHVSDPVELLSHARECLQPDGAVIISVPNVAHWTVRLKLLAGRFDYKPTGIMDATHLRWFTMNTIREVVVAAGFKVIEQDVSRGAWLPVYADRAPWKWFSANRRKQFLNRLCRSRPGLFGCQHVVKARRI